MLVSALAAVGAWAGSILLPMDWGFAWLRWPGPAIGGALTAQSMGLLAVALAEIMTGGEVTPGVFSGAGSGTERHGRSDGRLDVHAMEDGGHSGGRGIGGSTSTSRSSSSLNGLVGDTKHDRSIRQRGRGVKGTKS